MNSRKRLTHLLRRDGNLCGVHVGGCAQEIQNRADASVDHIFTQSFFKDREVTVRREQYNSDWNIQPMHLACNHERGGQIYGFPLFSCSCHWLKIEEVSEGHVLKLYYKTNTQNFAIVVSSAKHNFVSGKIRTGKFSHEFGGRTEIETSGVWSMDRGRPGETGITGRGQLGHVFPRIAPEEVELFNRLEVQRIEGNPEETIEKFNQRMDPMSMKVYWRNA